MLLSSQLPPLGYTVIGTIVEKVTNAKWRVSVPELPREWVYILRSRNAKLYTPGDQDTFWVYGIDLREEQLLLSDSTFGRLPISDRMRPRYIQGLEAALAIIANPNASVIGLAPALSEAKGMMNRCLRKDQWDWLTVYNILGQPERQVLHQVAEQFGALSRALHRGSHDEIILWANHLNKPELRSMFERALAQIVERAPRLTSAKIYQPVSKDGVALLMIEDGLEASDPSIISQTTKAKLERANAIHRATLDLLVNFLTTQGFLVERSRFIDAYCRLKTGPAIFEVKSITDDNERTQCRSAISQLYEYRYLHHVPEATLWLVLSAPPRLEWIIDYLEQEHHIGMFWLEEGHFCGPGLLRLLESSSASRRRERTED